MNYGRFFRLNQSLSKVEDGVAIYDYIDLPAYFGSAEANRMSPQYPISVAITPDAVCFRLHYSAFKIECKGINEDPHYAYDKEDIYDKSLNFERRSDVGLAHMEEVILELPYTDAASHKLPHIIKNIYNTRFPQIVDEKTSMGGRYLEQIIRKRFPETESKNQSKETKNQNIEDSLYKRIREVTDKTASYSTLWLMGLIKDNQISVYDEKNTKNITGFLRKLLLDFMFDMIHSDVFESNTYYASMREGLMNDFFFSSIVKKSEFYYYRSLIGERFSNIKDDSSFILSSQKNVLLSKDFYKRKKLRNLIAKTIKCKRGLIPSKNTISRLVCNWLLSLLEKKEAKYRSELYSINEAIQNHEATIQNIDSTNYNIKNLYAERLNAAEEAWMDAIMSPFADKLFSFSPEWYEDIKFHKINEDTFRVSDSWFVDPEEEMRRIVFPLSKKNNQKETLYLNSHELSQFIGSIDDSSVVNRNTKVSKWFYHRFDFKDSFRLHLFNGGHLIFFSILTLFVLTLIGTNIFKDWGELFWKNPEYLGTFPIIAFCVFLFIVIKFRLKINKNQNTEKIDYCLAKIRYKRNYNITVYYTLCFFSLSVFLFCYHSLTTCTFLIKVFFTITVPLITFLIYKKIFDYKKDLYSSQFRWPILVKFIRVYRINNIHLLLPRLVASITAAWVMLVIGNDIFKEQVSWPIWVIITFIVFVFILYENDKTLPNISIGTKVLRAFELMLISYSISLIIGIFAMDVIRKTIYNMPEEMPMKIVSYPLSFLDNCESLTLTVFPDFLIPFSFLAMFIGVFIQMIFEDKHITEL